MFITIITECGQEIAVRAGDIASVQRSYGSTVIGLGKQHPLHGTWSVQTMSWTSPRSPRCIYEDPSVEVVAAALNRLTVFNQEDISDE